MPLQIPQQELFSPVTNYYKGKAIRQDLATAKKQEELLDLQIAEAKKPAPVDQKELDRQRDRVQASIAEAGASAILATQDNPDPALRTRVFQDTLERLLGPEAAEAMKKQWDVNQDNIIDDDRWAEIEGVTFSAGKGLQEEASDEGFTLTPGSRRYDESGNEIASNPKTEGGSAGYAAKDTYIADDGKEYHGWYDDNGKFHKTGVLAKDASGVPVDFEPHNVAEGEAAEALIDKDKVLSKLDADDEDIAKEILANDIRQLQAAGFDYQDAAIMAVEKLKKKLRDVPGWFGSHKELSLGDGGLADNEFLGKDGNIYVEDGNGGFRRKD